MADHWELEDANTVYFWGGVLSNWAKFSFAAELKPNAETATFNCAEQYMMAVKAVTFKDAHALSKIMLSNSPKEQKALGRAIEGYSDYVWDMVARDFTYPGIYEKFRQNDGIGDLLLSTGDKHLVEASPFDRKWGVGFDHLHAPENRDKWGSNWLGQMLMKARDDIRNHTNSSFKQIDWTEYDPWTS